MATEEVEQMREQIANFCGKTIKVEQSEAVDDTLQMLKSVISTIYGNKGMDSVTINYMSDKDNYTVVMKRTPKIKINRRYTAPLNAPVKLGMSSKLARSSTSDTSSEDERTSPVLPAKLSISEPRNIPPKTPPTQDSAKKVVKIKRTPKKEKGNKSDEFGKLIIGGK